MTLPIDTYLPMLHVPIVRNIINMLICEQKQISNDGTYFKTGTKLFNIYIMYSCMYIIYLVYCITNPMPYINIHQVTYIIYIIYILFIHKYIHDTYTEASSLIKRTAYT